MITVKSVYFLETKKVKIVCSSSPPGDKMNVALCPVQNHAAIRQKKAVFISVSAPLQAEAQFMGVSMGGANSTGAGTTTFTFSQNMSQHSTRNYPLFLPYYETVQH